MPNPPLAALQLDATALRPLIEQVVAATVAQLDTDRAQLNGKLAYSEAEAAGLLSLERHQLRDERRRGRIGASLGPGKKILYSRSDLETYLRERRWTQN